MRDSITDAIVRIFTPSGEVAGPGFLVDEKHVLTHVSVVERALDALYIKAVTGGGEDDEPPELPLEFPFAKPGSGFKARLVGRDRSAPPAMVEDVVKLELTKAPPASSRPCPLVAESKVWEEFFPSPSELHPIVSPTELDENCHHVALSILAGRLVFFLGAGANRCDRPQDATFQIGQYLPDGWELANHLARNSAYPRREPKDLLRVSQYIAIKLGQGDLYEKIRKVFVPPTYAANSVHRFIASLPGRLNSRAIPNAHQLIVTTNYDDVLESTFDDAGEKYHLVTYIAEGAHRGRFLHRRPDGGEKIIKSPNSYGGLPVKDFEVEETIILKVHGAFNRDDEKKDSYVITEDDYISYLSQKNASNPVPSSLEKLMRRKHLLFLGYSLRDWNLRVILRRIWEQRGRSLTSWSIQLNPDELECKFWGKYEVDILNVRLERYVSELAKRL
jgi:hypothetical protein